MYKKNQHQISWRAISSRADSLAGARLHRVPIHKGDRKGRPYIGFPFIYQFAQFVYEYFPIGTV